MEESKTENDVQLKNVKCSSCKSNKYPSQFVNAKGKILKSCSECREKSALQREKNKCKHGKRKSYCKDCNGSAFCIHKKRKTLCKECDGKDQKVIVLLESKFLY